ncbi:replication endonuclease [Pasteurella skyensis]|uniref:Replication endonuclease n=1 Tax=Phocoenobacter skyensis TaxID=97481 RepID=A0AAJ6NBC9_9PAST|nr:replication endonuclease [Pasteurella skyensis]MDP8173660.1 replication endonuclease [Pasteurella skyensis]MDP8178028.1 replication endonuclease [Pasteurella skyensis]
MAGYVKPQYAQAEKPRPAGLGLLSMEQQSLFIEDPDNHEDREQHLRQYPKHLARFFAKAYQRQLKAYGNKYAMLWLNKKMASITPRMELVMQQYADVTALFKMPYQEVDLMNGYEYIERVPKNETPKQRYKRIQRRVRTMKNHITPIAERLEKSKNQFKQLHLTPLCYQNQKQLKQNADSIAFIMRKTLDDYVDPRMEQAIDQDSAKKILMGGYQKMVEICEHYQIKPPYHLQVKKKKRLTASQIETGILKLLCPDFWFNKLKKIGARMKEHLSIAVGMVHGGTGGYVSNERLSAFKQQKEANYKFIKNCIITNILDENEQLELLDTWLKSSSNPKIRRIELMTRLSGFEEYAEAKEHQAVFITLTAPSKYHAMRSNGGVNPKWNGASPIQTQAYLKGVWAKIRTALSNRNIKTYGFRIVEPHHDATPHWHLMLFAIPNDISTIKDTFKKYAYQEDGGEKGAKEHRLKFDDIDKAKGGATAYLAKYISKNIDGAGMNDLFDDETGEDVRLTAQRVQAWASLWGIRQFQQFGGAGIGAWREFRKLGSIKQDDEIIDTIRAITDVGCWATYTDYMGGATARRKDLKAKLHYLINGETKYKEERRKIDGIENNINGVVVLTRLKEWKIGKKPQNWDEQKAQKINEKRTGSDIAPTDGVSRPWTCVSNCTGLKNEQYSKEAINRIKKRTNHNAREDHRPAIK